VLFNFTGISNGPTVTNSNNGSSGDILVISGNNLKGATAVTAGGTPATISCQPAGSFTYIAPDFSVNAVPSAPTIAPGADFTVDLNINIPFGFLGWKTDINFDASKIQAKLNSSQRLVISDTGFFRDYVLNAGGAIQSGSTPPVVDNVNGHITGIVYGATNVATGLTGTGKICSITFSAKSTASGSAAITALNFKVTNERAQTIGTSINPLVTGANIGVGDSSDNGDSGSPPTITAFNPQSATVGDTVTITGTHLTGVTAVSFGGTAAQSYNVSSATQITAVVGNGTSGLVSVTTPNGTATKDGFVYSGAATAPTITAFSPLAGKTGDTITITGTNLSGATSVIFGNVAATITSNTATQILATVAGGATGLVSVTTAQGTATKDGFTYYGIPTVTSFSPASGNTGTTVTIYGTYFTGATAVNIGGVAAQSFTVNSATQITAVVASGAITGVISVTAPGGTGTSSTNFTIVAAPTLNSFGPVKATTGTVVVIAGTNLSEATSVTFGGVAAASYVVNSAIQITAVVGSGSSGSIAVTTAGGTATITGFTYQSPRSDITITATPSVTSVTPGSAFTVDLMITTSVGFLGWQATVNFDASKMQYNSIDEGAFLSGYASGLGGDTINPTVPTIDNSGGHITNISYSATGLSGVTGATGTGKLCTLHFTATSGASGSSTISLAAVTITDKDASSIINATVSGGTINFQGAPTISSFTPTSGNTGNTITIYGSNLTGATAVSFGGTAAQSFSVVSSTQINAVLGNGSSGNVNVTTPGGTASLSGFTFTGTATAPTITSFSPSEGGSGTSITITGTNFTGATVVSIGGTSASGFNVNSATQITAVVGSGTTGKIAVTTANGTATSSASFTFVSSNAAPTITSFTPSSGKSGTTIKITGTHFNGATSVKIGGTAAAGFTLDSATQISATLGDGSTGTISITTPNGTATSSSPFTFVTATDAPLKSGSTHSPTTTTTVAANNSGNDYPSQNTTTQTSVADSITFNLTGKVDSNGTLTQTFIEEQQGTSADPLQGRLEIKQGTILLDKDNRPVTSITINRVTPPATETRDAFAIAAFECLPDGSHFTQPITITLTYNPGSIPVGFSEKKLVTAYYDSQKQSWLEVDCKVDSANHLIQIKVDHFTTFMVVAKNSPAVGWNLFVIIIGIEFALAAAIMAYVFLRRRRARMAVENYGGVKVTGVSTPFSTTLERRTVDGQWVSLDTNQSSGLSNVGQESVRSFQIDRGNVNCQEIGLVFDKNSNLAGPNRPMKITLKLDPESNSEEVIEVRLVQKQNQNKEE
jgi:hypothetical protein